MSLQKITQVNTLPPEDFITLLARIYEHSQWVAETVVNQRPFKNPAALRDAMAQVVATAPPSLQLELIQAHPDLAGRLAQQNQLTPESTREQAAAGLAAADPALITQIQTLNADYRARFDFPFIICARLNKVEAILDAMLARLPNDRDEEIATALAEIDKIAALRLQDLIEEN
jgi:2-oxo-4-hydroxy-4-carboxy-5-ureidoimidazoline decarboxylase